jgi:hypothetical protein
MQSQASNASQEKGAQMKLNEDQRKAVDEAFSHYAGLLNKATDESAVDVVLRKLQCRFSARYIREFAKTYSGSTRMRANTK